jgi:pyruvate formate lyase activating enzyme
MARPNARFIEKRDGKLQCSLCPNNCLIAPGKSGICKVRVNDNGSPGLPYYGKLSAVSVDPIEKKPLYHFHPSKPILSIGFVGCSFRCPFCQNYSISQSVERGLEYTGPKQIVESALRRNSFGIAYTYSEPIVHFEYVSDCSAEARKHGLKNVLVTNGYINPEPARELVKLTDAANIDLKGFQDNFYSREIGGALQPVKDFIEYAAANIHVEVTTLVIPGKNDGEDEIRAIASFLADIRPDIPYHLSCYYPTYTYTIPRTRPESVRRLAEIAREKLHYVYLGNVGLEETNTYCPECGKLIVRRSGYSTAVSGLDAEGRCTGCGARIPIVT